VLKIGFDFQHCQDQHTLSVDGFLCEFKFAISYLDCAVFEFDLDIDPKTCVEKVCFNGLRIRNLRLVLCNDERGRYITGSRWTNRGVSSMIDCAAKLC
jgi:hypothetical protein